MSGDADVLFALSSERAILDKFDSWAQKPGVYERFLSFYKSLPVSESVRFFEHENTGYSSSADDDDDGEKTNKSHYYSVYFESASVVAESVLRNGNVYHTFSPYPKEMDKSPGSPRNSPLSSPGPRSLRQTTDNSAIANVTGVECLVLTRTLYERSIAACLTTLRRGVELYSIQVSPNSGSGLQIKRVKSGTPCNRSAFSDILTKLDVAVPRSCTAALHILPLSHDFETGSVSDSALECIADGSVEQSIVKNSKQNNWLVLLACTDNSTLAGALCFADDQQLSVLSSVMCRLSIGECEVSTQLLDGTHSPSLATSLTNCLETHCEATVIRVDQRDLLSTMSMDCDRLFGLFENYFAANQQALANFRSSFSVAADLASAFEAEVQKTRIFANLAATLNVPKTMELGKVVKYSLLTLLGRVFSSAGVDIATIAGSSLEATNNMSTESNRLSTFVSGSEIMGSVSGKYMLLTNADMLNLGVVAQLEKRGTNVSLLSYLDITCTKMGATLLQAALRAPLCDKNEITKRLLCVKKLVESGPDLEDLRNTQLRRIPNLTLITDKISSLTEKDAPERFANCLKDVVTLYSFALNLPTLVNSLTNIFPGEIRDKNAPSSLFLPYLYVATKALDTFIRLVEATVDLEAAKNNEYTVLSSLDAELLDVKTKLDKVMAEIDKEKSFIEEGLAKNQKVSVIITPVQGISFKIPKTGQAKLQAMRLHDLVVLENKTTGVKFRTGRISSLSEKYLVLKGAYTKKQTNVAAEVTKVAATYMKLFKLVSGPIATLDMLAAFARRSIDNNWIMPVMLPMLADKQQSEEEEGQREIILKDCRHPLIEAAPDVESFIPNNITLTSEKRFLLVSGANMGGKSTYLKSCGLCVLMAQIGCFVPCSSATVSICDRISVRAGTGDSLTKGLSTFMYEMVSMAEILIATTSNSLVLVDELGRGTSVSDGFGLAWSMAEELAYKRKCLGIFATHIHELTSLADTKDSTFSNVHAQTAISNGRLKLLYKILPGSTDKSFGIQIAEIAGYPHHVIESAKELAGITDMDDAAGNENEAGDERMSKKRKNLFNNILSSNGNENENENVEENYDKENERAMDLLTRLHSAKLENDKEKIAKIKAEALEYLSCERQG